MKFTAFSFYKILLLIFFMLCSGLIATYLGKDLSWDIANYHYYNAYAFLHHRLDIDYWPVSFIHAYFTPTADFISYFLVNYFPSYWAVFFSGCLHGINLWLTYCITRYFLLDDQRNIKANAQQRLELVAIFMTFLGAYSALYFQGIGDFRNDHIACLFVLTFIYLQIQTWEKYNTTSVISLRLISLSGLFLGIGVGIKLTTAPFFIGALLTACLLPIRISQRVKIIGLLIIWVSIGMFFSAGYWMLFLWQRYHNPFFPFFNGIFHSPYFPLSNFHYTQFLPDNIWQALFFPFYFSWWGTPKNEELFRDVRFAVIYVLVILYVIKWCWNIKTRKTQSLTLPTFWLFTFALTSYITWEYYFSIVRYIAPLAILAPLIIYLLMKQIFSQPMIRFLALTLTYYALIFTTIPPMIIREPWYSISFFNVNLPHEVSMTQKKPTTILIAYSAYALHSTPKPQSYLIPFFPPTWQFIGIPFIDKNVIQFELKDEENIRERLQDKNRQYYLLTSNESLESFYVLMKKWGFMPAGKCLTIESDRQVISNTQTFLCPLAHARSF